SGHGEHIYLMLEKRNMTAMEMFNAVARHFGVRRSAVGYAGLKDKQAITRQIVSVHVPGKRPEDFPHFEHERVTVLWADLHENKLRRGHLAGNRFSIKIRDVEIAQTRTVLRAIQTLERVGVPDRIGAQRFGYLGNNHLIGRALLSRDARAAIDLMLSPSDHSPEVQNEAREHFAAGRFAEARKCFPRNYRTEWAVLGALANGEHPEQAIDAVEPDLLGFYISAFQSAVYNAVLDRRVLAGELGTLMPGDVALDRQGRKPFDIDEVALTEEDLLARYSRFEFSASGPMWGAKMRRAKDRVGQVEAETLASFGVDPGRLPDPSDLDIPMVGGTRRPLRIPLENSEVEGGGDEHGTYIRCAFDLPRGA
ncbi:MAG: tRNA pseudouridine(13) synthase TruD, partial [Phycisphaerales bacterium]|nr:tRNA pseudouridine(13) synthase TruD [Phycisphaerales bacterium]